MEEVEDITSGEITLGSALVISMGGVEGATAVAASTGSGAGSDTTAGFGSSLDCVGVFDGDDFDPHQRDSDLVVDAPKNGLRPSLCVG